MDAKAEAADLKAHPLPPEAGTIATPVFSVDFTTAADDMVLSSIYEIDQQTKNLQDEILRLQQQKMILMDRAIRDNIRQDRYSELREIPGKKFRTIDAERIQKDWPDLSKQAAEIEYRRLKEKISKDGPTLKTLETVFGKQRVDQYCTVKQGPSTFEVIPRGRF